LAAKNWRWCRRQRSVGASIDKERRVGWVDNNDGEMLRVIPDDKVLRRNSRRLFSNKLFPDNVRLIAQNLGQSIFTV
jgi:hypothetical protein